MYPFFVSENQATSCFHLLSPSAQYNAFNFPALPGFKSASLIPEPLSLDPILVLLYQAIGNEIVSTTPALDGILLSPDNANFDIDLVFGVGVRGFGLFGMTMDFAAAVRVDDVLVLLFLVFYYR